MSDNFQQPYYQPPQQDYQFPPQAPIPPKKKKRWPLFAGIGCGVVIVVAICAIVGTSAGILGSAANTATTSSVSSGTNASPSSSPSTSSTTVAKVGQTITVNSVSCTLRSVAVLQADQYNSPKAGYQYIVVSVIIKNNGNAQTDYNPLDFHIKSSSGNVTDVDYSTPSSYTANNILESGSLDPGGTVSGDIILQAPIGDAKAELTWAASIFASNTQYGWTLGSY